MKIAYFSPLNPLKSGISDYSEYLLKALSRHIEVDVWVDGFIPTDQYILNNFNVIDFGSNPHCLDRLTEYDEIIYNIGNNPWYHTGIYDVFLKYNGIVILHEYVLYYLVTGYILDHLHNGEEYLEELRLNHGDRGYSEGLKILRGHLPPLQYKKPEELPLNKRLIEHAKGIIVHSLHAKHEVQKINQTVPCVSIGQIGPDPETIKLSDERIREIKGKYGINNGDTIIASFGYVSATKRIHQVLHALANLNCHGYKYLLVGEGDYVKDLVKKYNLDNKVIFTGFTTINEFDDLIAISDIVINLRYPYMGETSASMVRALLLGKATIVSDVGWFSELPDDSAIKVPVDASEIDVLKKSITRLLNDQFFKSQLEKKAKEYSRYFYPEVITKNIVSFINACNYIKFKENLAFSITDKIGEILCDIGKGNCDEEYVRKVSIEIYSIFR